MKGAGDERKPLLAISDDGKKSRYLVGSGSPTELPAGGEGEPAIEGAPEWLEADEIRAIRPAKWKP